MIKIAQLLIAIVWGFGLMGILMIFNAIMVAFVPNFVFPFDFRWGLIAGLYPLSNLFVLLKAERW